MNNIEWNKVTWYSKLVAVILFVATFAIAFDLGIMWQTEHMQDAVMVMPSGGEWDTGRPSSNPHSTLGGESAGVACPDIAKQCPDGSYVSPSGPNCAYPACPTH